MDGTHFIDFAQGLAASQDTPAACRTSVSRSYYGAFHLARNLLTNFGFICRNRENEHLWVQRHFRNCGTACADAAGRLLENLHTSRKEADYHFDIPQAETPKNAQACALRASEFVRLFQQCLAAQAAIKTEMDTYRKKLNMT